MIKRIFRGVLVAVLWCAVWYALALIVNRPVILPMPHTVAVTLVGLLGTADFYAVCGMSLLRIFAGLAAGILLGTLSAVVCSLSRAADRIIAPAVHAVKATPVASVIILMLFFFARGSVPVITAALMVLPIIFGNVRKGIAAAPKPELEVAYIYGMPRSKRLRYIYIPSVVPYFSAGCASALGLAWKAGIAAEVICTPSGSIGSRLNDSKVYLESADLFAWTAVVILLSFAIERLLMLILKKYGKAAV